MDIEVPDDVMAVLRSVAILLGDDSTGFTAADPAAGAAEDRTITRARARQAREHSAALSEHAEQLWQRHRELRAASTRPHEPISGRQHQAIGILVLIFGADPAQAGRLLVMLSQHHGCSPETFAGRLVEACVRDAAPSTGRSDSTPDRHAAPLTVRRAVAFIEQHLRDDITIDDISSASGIGQRALQRAFRRHIDTTPIRYLRSVRMERAHRQLLAADPSRGDTVAAIADTWHFTHHGRFALDYRATYGISPAGVLQH